MKKLFIKSIILLIVLFVGLNAKAVTYQISGPSTLTTTAVYTITTTDGSALPSGITATWNYPSEFYRIYYSKTSIELGRREAVGFYTLTATLNNGTVISKRIEAIKDNPTPPVIPTQNEVILYVTSISGHLSGMYSNINQYTLASRNSFTTTTGDLYFLCTLKNNTSSSLTISTSNLKLAYGYQNSPYTTTVYGASGSEPLTSINLPAGNNGFDIVIKAQSNWSSNLKRTSDNYTYMDFYFVYTHNTGQQLFNGSYCIINGSRSLQSLSSQQSVSVFPTTVISDVTIKSTDNSSIKSIKVVSAMGNLMKIKSYNDNCMKANLDLSNYKNGIYYLQVEKSNGVETVKVIKK